MKGASRLERKTKPAWILNFFFFFNSDVFSVMGVWGGECRDNCAGKAEAGDTVVWIENRSRM